MKKILFVLFLSIILAGCGDTNIALSEDFNETVELINGNVPTISADFVLKASQGSIPGAYTVNKFGANDGIGTSIEPITLSGNYQTPQTAQTIEILSSNANDNSTGSGARVVLVVGLNASGDEISEEVSLSGTTPVTLSNQFLRVYRAYVLESGTYATQSASSHIGYLTIRGVGGGVTWATIDTVDGGFGVSQTEIGVYTIPKGYHCLLLGKDASIDANKFVNLYFFQRTGVNKTSAPYDAMRLVEKHIGLTGTLHLEQKGAIAKFEELTDVGFMAETTSGTASVSVEFELLCLDNILFPQDN